MYAVKSNVENRPTLSGKIISKAYAKKGFKIKPVIGLEMNAEGTIQWERITEKAYTNNSNIAMVINNVVYSAPNVSSGPIIGGRSEIMSAFTMQEAKEFAAILLLLLLVKGKLQNLRCSIVQASLI